MQHDAILILHAITCNYVLMFAKLTVMYFSKSCLTFTFQAVFGGSFHGRFGSFINDIIQIFNFFDHYLFLEKKHFCTLSIWCDIIYVIALTYVQPLLRLCPSFPRNTNSKWLSQSSSSSSHKRRQRLFVSNQVFGIENSLGTMVR